MIANDSGLDTMENTGALELGGVCRWGHQHCFCVQGSRRLFLGYLHSYGWG
jgi:hypothetical protein